MLVERIRRAITLQDCSGYGFTDEVFGAGFGNDRLVERVASKLIHPWFGGSANETVAFFIELYAACCAIASTEQNVSTRRGSQHARRVCSPRLPRRAPNLNPNAGPARKILSGSTNLQVLLAGNVNEPGW